MENQKKTQNKPMPKSNKSMGDDKKSMTTKTDTGKSSPSKGKK